MPSYSDLDRLLNAALQGGNTMQQIAEGNNPIGNYAAWKIYKNAADHKVGPKADPGTMTDILVHPFNTDYATGAAALYIKTKAQASAIGFGGMTAVLGAHAALTVQGVRIPQSNKVTAARVIVRNKTKGTEKTSRITKLKYTPSSTASKSIPFGRLDTNESYSDAVKKIADAIKAVGTHRASFREEKWDETISVVTSA